MTELTEHITIDILESYANYTEECAYKHHREGSSCIGVLIYEWKFAIEVNEEKMLQKEGISLSRVQRQEQAFCLCSEKIIWFGNTVRSMTVRRCGSGDWQGSDGEGSANVLSFYQVNEEQT